MFVPGIVKDDRPCKCGSGGKCPPTRIRITPREMKEQHQHRERQHAIPDDEDLPRADLPGWNGTSRALPRVDLAVESIVQEHPTGIKKGDGQKRKSEQGCTWLAAREYGSGENIGPDGREVRDASQAKVRSPAHGSICSITHRSSRATAVTRSSRRCSSGRTSQV